MSNLVTKLEEIERKVLELIEQNAHYEQLCNNLLQVRKELETENRKLRADLVKKTALIRKLKQHSSGSSPVAPPQEELQGQEEGIKREINQHIEKLDVIVKWLSNL